MIKFYLGTHMVHWLAEAHVPLFVSHRRLALRRTLPRAAQGWALDSGGFSELGLYGGWRTTPEEYVTAVRRYETEIARLEWAATQDWMCEPAMLAKTGLTVQEHQRRTVANFLRCQQLWYAETDDESPFMPPVQGQTAREYLDCVREYADHGVDLRDYPLVGVGSICRRQATNEIGEIIAALQDELGPDVPLHMFGMKRRGLQQYGHQICTADSLAWSYRARHSAPLPGCTHQRCSSCLKYALRWRSHVLNLPGTHYEPFGLTPRTRDAFALAS